MKINKEIEKIIECIKEGEIGERLAEIFFPKLSPIPKECALWDYKETFDGEKASYAELAKDILSLFNSYGGYLLIGVSEQEKDECFEITGFQKPDDFTIKVRGAIESYISSPIDINIAELKTELGTVLAILVPCRPADQLPVFLVKNGPERKPGKPIFTEKSTYFRENDKTLPATIAAQWEFLNSERNPAQIINSDISLSAAPVLSNAIPNNLPDRNLICPHLFGREEILASLWSWISDELEPVRLLAGPGGKGKTSIAYEFASRFYRNAPKIFLHVLWLSAKKRQFRADRNEYIELPECWYSTPIELLQALCLGTAALTQDELETSEDNEYTLQKKLRQSLQLIPSLIIVDDIDSLSQPEQKRVFELVQQISSAATSKFLLTTRANFAFSDSQCIQVPGLEGTPYQDFVNDRVIKLAISPLKPFEIKGLQRSSSGSPLWTDSILRLMKQGYTFQNALKEWNGKPGEDARAAALKKELDALGIVARRILFVAAVLGESSRAELIEITKVGKTEFNEAITELQTLFLVDAPKIIENEPRFSVPASTAVAVTDAAEHLVADHQRLRNATKEYIQRIEKAKGSNGKSQIGAIINQTIALMISQQVEKAIETVEAALALYPSHPDLLLLKGRCLQNSNPKQATAALDLSYKKGQRKPLLFELWYQLSIDQKQYPVAFDVSNLAIDSKLDRTTWLPLRARAQIQIGLMRQRDGSTAAAVELIKKGADDIFSTILLCNASSKEISQHALDLEAIHDAAWRMTHNSRTLESDILLFDIAINSIQRKDYRVANAERLTIATEKLILGVDLSSDSGQAKAARSRLATALDTLTKAASNSSIPIKTKEAYLRAVKQLESASHSKKKRNIY
jgi:tetratricopeptide (TPR) repeat protein